MSDDSGLTFDADGFVRMDDLPDVDPDSAIPESQLDHIRLVLQDDPIPARLESGWDSLVAGVDAVDGSDSISLIPDDSGSDAISGPIMLIDDPADDANLTSMGDAPTDDIGDDDLAAAAPDPSDEPESSWSWPDDDPTATDPVESSWTPDDPLDLMGLGDNPFGGYDPLAPPDDPLDIDVVELHHDDGDGTPGSSPH